MEFIGQYIQKFGTSPTLQEIADALGVSSLATVHEHLQTLTKKGVIRRFEGAVRGIELLDHKIGQITNGVELPILGFIAAGSPIQPMTDPNATLKVASSMLSGKKRSFVLQVRGDSMIEEGILDGDFVVIEERKEAKDGEIVVALLDNGLATLKKFFREASRIRLEPANSTMKPIFARNVTVQGTVVGLVRRFGQ
ncbi:MAG: LexA repressor [Microgenomates group bacterium GW2011_GWA2_46_7]|nr:MAG: LexA repressor [Microgenomates group bacterium GW2011_GWA2_46_7]